MGCGASSQRKSALAAAELSAPPPTRPPPAPKQLRNGDEVSLPAPTADVTGLPSVPLPAPLETKGGARRGEASVSGDAAAVVLAAEAGAGSVPTAAGVAVVETGPTAAPAAAEKVVAASGEADEAIPGVGMVWQARDGEARAALAKAESAGLGGAEELYDGLCRIARAAHLAWERTVPRAEERWLPSHACASVREDSSSPLRPLLAPSAEGQPLAFVGDFQDFFAAEALRRWQAEEPSLDLLSHELLGGAVSYLKGSTSEELAFSLASRDGQTEAAAASQKRQQKGPHPWLTSLFFLLDGELPGRAGRLPDARALADAVLDGVSPTRDGRRSLRLTLTVASSRAAMAAVCALVRFGRTQTTLELDFKPEGGDEAAARAAVVTSIAQLTPAVLRPTGLAHLILSNVDAATTLPLLSPLKATADFEALALSLCPPPASANDDGTTPLAIAVEAADDAAVRALLRGGAERALPDAAGFTPMMRALRQPPAVRDAFLRFSDVSHGRTTDGAHAVGAAEAVRTGAICVDMGTGESKVYAALTLGEDVELRQLGATVKPAAVEAAAALAEGDRTAVEELCRSLCASVAEAPKDVAYRRTAVVGVTAWYRRLSSTQRKQAGQMLTAVVAALDGALRQALGVGVRAAVEEVAQEAEGYYEMLAVEYAVTRSKLPLPAAVVAGGSGSVQVTGLDASFSVESLLKAAAKDVEAAADAAGRAAALDAFRRLTALELSAKGVALRHEMLRMAADADGLRLLVMGSFFYAAVAARVVIKGSAYAYQPADAVVAKLRSHAASATANATDAANCARLETLLSLLFGEAYLPSVQCLFARDWTFGGRPFRTTWVVGWWLAGGAAAPAKPSEPTTPPCCTAALLRSHASAGTRLAVADRASGAQLFSGTVVSVGGDGSVVVREDNGDGAPRAICADAVANEVEVRFAPNFVYPSGWRLSIRSGEAVVDATVVRWLGRLQGNRHELRLEGGQVELVDLHATNHALQRFGSDGQLRQALSEYCAHVADSLSRVEDAITGKKLEVEKQLQYIHLASGDDEIDVDTQTGEAVVGVRGEELSALDDIRSLAAMIVGDAARSDAIARGGHTARPVLIRAGPGTGKTWSVQQLAYHMATIAAARSLRLVPLLIYVQRLARLRPTGDASVGSDLILEYIRLEFGNQPARRDALIQALELRQLVLIIDGVDEAAGLKEMIEQFLFHRVLPLGIHLAVTSRPEGVRLRYYRRWLILNLAKLTEAQQASAIEQQLQTNEVFHYLSKFDRIRRSHDALYTSKLFPAAAERHVIESVAAPDRFFDGDGRRLPTMRQRSRERQAVVRVSADGATAALRSATLREAEALVAPLLDAVDAAVESGELAKVEARCAELDAADATDAASGGDGGDGGADGDGGDGGGGGADGDGGDGGAADSAVATRQRRRRRLAMDLARLALKRRREHAEMELLERPAAADLSPAEVRNNAKVLRERRRLFAAVPYLDGRGLWRAILVRTDELYVEAEAHLPAFASALSALVAQCGADATLTVGSLKEPPRVHEKAWDDYADYFDDGELPEANVLDVLRARVTVVDDSRRLLAAPLEMLGTATAVAGGRAVSLQHARTKNKFAALDPTHFRNQLHNVAIAVDGVATTFGEVQVHHAEILAFNEAEGAHACYNYFRSLFKAKYEEALDEMLEKSMAVFAQIAATPVLLSMLIVALDEAVGADDESVAAVGAVSGGALPRDLFELYGLAMRKVLRRRMRDDGGGALLAREMLRRVAVANQLRGIEAQQSVRIFYREDVQLALCAAFREGDVGRTVSIVGGQVRVDGERRAVEWEDAAWGRARHADVAGVVKAVDARFRGLVSLEGGGDFENPMGEPSAEFALWERLAAEEEGVPLVKTLDVQAGEYQFKHLSFQEALFVETLMRPDGGALRAIVWGSDAAARANLGAPFLRNAWTIGQGHLGAPLAAARAEWRLGRLEPIGAEALCHVLRGAASLRSLHLAGGALPAAALSKLGCAIRESRLTLAHASAACDEPMPAEFALALLTPALESLDCLKASLDAEGAEAVLPALAALLMTEGNRLRTIRFRAAADFSPQLLAVLEALEAPACIALSVLQLLSATLLAGRPTIGSEVELKSTGERGVVIADEHDAQPYRVRLDSGVELDDYLREADVQPAEPKEGAIVLGAAELQRIAAALSATRAPLSTLVIGRLELHQRHLGCKEGTAVALRDAPLSDAQAAVVGALLASNSQLTSLDLSGSTAVSSAALAALARGLETSGATLRELRLRGVTHAAATPADAADAIQRLLSLAATAQLHELDLSSQRGPFDTAEAAWLFADADGAPPPLAPLPPLLCTAGNALAILRVGGHGPWPAGAGAALLAAVGSEHCALEELNVDGSRLADADARALAVAVVSCRSLRRLTTAAVALPVAELRDGSCVELSFGGRLPSVADAAVVGALLVDCCERSSLETLELSRRAEPDADADDGRFAEALGHLADAQRRRPSPLREVRLCRTDLSSSAEAAAALADLVGACPQLTTLDLTEAQLGHPVGGRPVSALSLLAAALTASAAPLSRLLLSRREAEMRLRSTREAWRRLGSEPSLLTAELLEAVCGAALAEVDLRHWSDEEGPLGSGGAALLRPLARLMATEGNHLRAVRLGGGGSWAEGAVSPLLPVLASRSCVLEELDLSHSALCAADARSLADAVLACGSLARLVVSSWAIPVGGLRAPSGAVDLGMGGQRLEPTDMVVLGVLLREAADGLEIDADFSRSRLGAGALPALAEAVGGRLPRGLRLGLAEGCAAAAEMGSLLGSLLPGCGCASLDLSHNGLTAIPCAQTMDEIAAGVEVAMLVSEGNKFDETRLASTLSRFAGLTSLSVTAAHLAMSAASPLGAWLSSVKSLRELDLSTNRLADDAAPALAAALANGNLREMRLSRNHLGPAAGEALAGALCINANLELLDLSHNSLGRGARALAAAMPAATALRALGLAANALGPAEGAALRRALAEAPAALSFVALVGNAFGVVAASQLARYLDERPALRSLAKLDDDAPPLASEELSLADRLLCGLEVDGLDEPDAEADDDTPTALLYAWGVAAHCGHGVSVGKPLLLPFSHDVAVLQVACGMFGTLARSDTGDVWFWGTVGDALSSPTPKRIEELHDVVDVATTPSGYYHGYQDKVYVSAAATRDGSLYTWGANSRKQASPFESSSSFERPTKVVLYGPVRRACSSSSTQRFALRVACGVGFTLVYSAETPSGQRPSVVLFGEMKGIEPSEAADVRSLVHLPELDGINIARLTAGAFHGMALTDGGELWSFGDWSGPDSANGSLLGREWTASSDYARPAKVSLKHLQQDKDKLPPTLLELDSSTYSTIAVTSDGAAVTWGDSDGHGLGHTLGRCSVPTKVAIDDPVAHAAIAFTSGILVTAKQAIYTWGGGMWDGGIGGDHSEPTQLEWEFPEGYECARICISMGHGVLILRRKASRR